MSRGYSGPGRSVPSNDGSHIGDSWWAQKQQRERERAREKAAWRDKRRIEAIRTMAEWSPEDRERMGIVLTAQELRDADLPAAHPAGPTGITAALDSIATAIGTPTTEQENPAMTAQNAYDSAERDYLDAADYADRARQRADRTGRTADMMSAGRAAERVKRMEERVNDARAILDEEKLHARMADLNARANVSDRDLTMQELMELDRYNYANRTPDQIAWDDRVAEYNTLNARHGAGVRDKVTGPRRASGLLPIEGYEDVITHLEAEKKASDERTQAIVDSLYGSGQIDSGRAG